MRPLEIGDRVRIISLKMDGLVSHIDDEEVEIQVGSLRLRANPSDLQLVDDKMTKTEPASTRVIPAKGKREVFYPSPAMDLDIRGQRADDALAALDSYIDSAYLSGMPSCA